MFLLSKCSRTLLYLYVMFYLSNVLKHCSIICVLHMHIPYVWDYSIVGNVGAEISIIVNTLTRTVLLKQDIIQ